MLLSLYFLLELVGTDLGDDQVQETPTHEPRYLDTISANALLRTRFYATERIATFHQQGVLQASSIPFYDISAQTVQRLIQAWMMAPSPVWSILNGNLREKFIEPFETQLEALGAHLRQSITTGSHCSYAPVLR